LYNWIADTEITNPSLKVSRFLFDVFLMTGIELEVLSDNTALMLVYFSEL